MHQAVEVIGIDQSSSSVAKAKVNSHINGSDNASFHQADAFEYLKSLAGKGDRFDVVILDPPSFTKSRKNVTTALKGYKEINGLSLQIIRPGGFLISASCSHHITEESFLDCIESAARKTGKKLQLLEFAGASPDHPVLTPMAETRYLKFAVFSVS